MPPVYISPQMFALFSTSIVLALEPSAAQAQVSGPTPGPTAAPHSQPFPSTVPGNIAPHPGQMRLGGGGNDTLYGGSGSFRRTPGGDTLYGGSDDAFYRNRNRGPGTFFGGGR